MHVTYIHQALRENELLPDFQSAYHNGYSCETSLLALCNEALRAMEKKQITAVTIMDLCATFDMVDHDILLTVLKNCFGISSNVLTWFENYLRLRSFKVCVEDCYSQAKDLTFMSPKDLPQEHFCTYAMLV